MNDESEMDDPGQPGDALIDTAAIDALCRQLDTASARNLLEDCFEDLDRQIERFRQAGAQGDWAGCLTTLHGLRGFAVDYGAIALSREISVAKQALLTRDYPLLADCIPRLREVQRDTRSALMMRLAKFTATRLSSNDPARPAR